MRPLIFPNHLWGGPTDLSPGNPWGTDVLSPVTDGEHVFGHPFGHSSPGIHCQGGSYPCDLPTGYSCSTCSLLRNEMEMPFAQPGDVLATASRYICRDL